MTPETVMSHRQPRAGDHAALAAPLLLVALLTGLIVGAFQAATQINESTLSFIPKLIAIAATLVMTAPGC